MSKETADAHVMTERERTVRAPEHEIWLSFRDDAGAEHFDWWWAKTGKHLWFQAYKKESGAKP